MHVTSAPGEFESVPHEETSEYFIVQIPILETIINTIKNLTKKNLIKNSLNKATSGWQKIILLNRESVIHLEFGGSTLLFRIKSRSSTVFRNNSCINLCSVSSGTVLNNDLLSASCLLFFLSEIIK